MILLLKESSSVTGLLGWPDAERSTCLTVERCLHRRGIYIYIVVTCRQVIQSQHGSSRQREVKTGLGFLSMTQLAMYTNSSQ